MSELVRLDYLVWLAVFCRDAPDGIFKSNFFYAVTDKSFPHKIKYKQHRFMRKLVSARHPFIPVKSRRTEISARWKCYQHIPTIFENLKNIALNMPVWVPFCRQYIAGYCFVAFISEGFCYDLTEFTSYQYFHNSSFSSSHSVNTSPNRLLFFKLFFNVFV